MKGNKDKGCGSGSAGQPATARVLGKRLASVVDADQEQQLDALWLDRGVDTESESDDSQPRASSSLDRLPGGIKQLCVQLCCSICASIGPG